MTNSTIPKIAWLGLVAVLVGPLAFSQNTSELNPPLYKGVSVHVDGVYVTPVPSLPLTAVVEIESTLIFADGSTVVKKTVNNIARDFQRRIYNERRQLVSPS